MKPCNIVKHLYYYVKFVIKTNTYLNYIPTKCEYRTVPPMTNASSSAFPATHRTSKISALWRTGVTI